MLLNDDWGQPVRVDAPGALAGLNDFIGGLLAYETRAEHILATAGSHPGTVLAQVYAGFLWMFLESPQAPQRAQPFLEAAARALRTAGEADASPDAQAAQAREQGHVRLLARWIAGDIDGVLTEAEALIERFPRDLALVKLQQYFAFNRGDSPTMLRAILRVLPANDDNPYAHGMAAFAYEQCHLLDRAEASARRALALREREPWAQHALAHVLLTQGRIEEGAHLLEGWRRQWVGLNSFMSTHLYWHLALFHLARGRNEDALALYDGAVWGVSTSYSQDQAGAVQLLARLEWCGVDVGGRWDALAEFIAARGVDTVEPYLTLLYLYGLARAKRPEADVLLAAIKARAVAEVEGGGAPGASGANTAGTNDTRGSVTGGAPPLWSTVVWPAALGVAAHAHGDAASAWRPLSQAQPGLVRIGGSHAQRDLFALLQIDAASAIGERVEAQQALETRRRVDPDEVAVNRRLAVLYRQLDLPTLADEAAQRATLVAAPRGRLDH